MVVRVGRRRLDQWQSEYFGRERDSQFEWTSAVALDIKLSKRACKRLREDLACSHESHGHYTNDFIGIVRIEYLPDDRNFVSIGLSFDPYVNSIVTSAIKQLT
jgi:hypothetical protein